MGGGHGQEGLRGQGDQTDWGVPADREDGRPLPPSTQLRKIFSLDQHDRKVSE